MYGTDDQTARSLGMYGTDEQLGDFAAAAVKSERVRSWMPQGIRHYLRGKRYEPPRCEGCGLRLMYMMYCGGCKRPFCSKMCQLKHWDGRARECREVAA